MTDKKPDNAHDNDLFKSAFADVKPLPEVNEVDLRPPPPTPKVLHRHVEEQESAPDILSDYGEVEEVAAETV